MFGKQETTNKASGQLSSKTTSSRSRLVNLRMRLVLALVAFFFMVAAIATTMTGSAQIGSVTPGVSPRPTGIGGIRAALPPGATGLHFHGNPTDDAPCSGSGSADVAGCGGAKLLSRATLGTGAPGHWDVPDPAADGTADQNIYDPNWIWTLPALTTATLRGDMVVNWWGTCGACGPAGLDAEWDISLWADGVKVETWHVVATPPTPNVPALLSATVNIATNRTAATKFVLQIDPYFIDTQANTHIYYDSTTACPGSTGSAPCDSTVIMPVVDPLATPTPTPSPSPSPSPSPTPTPGVGLPRYFNYVSPFGDDAGEPSIGSNWGSEQSFSNSMFTIPNGGNSHYFGGFFPYMLKATWDDCASPANPNFEKKPLTLATTPRAFGDPILFTDNSSRPQARTFVSQLEGLTPAGSTTDYTDNDGASFSPSEGSGLPSNVDHQTFGGGPYHSPPPPGAGTLYPHAIYYCSQSIADAGCSLSLDGGVSFGPAVVIYTIADCGGLHGHVKVAPDGTVYVPNKDCGSGDVGVVVSEDNGITWTVKVVPPSTTDGQWDPSVGIAADGAVYLGYRDVNGRARTAVSFTKGNTWVRDQDVGAQLGLKKIAFPAVVAGDGGMTTGRAAFAFYGTTTDGDDTVQAPGLFTNPDGSLAVWYLYISSTFDGGQTWTTQNVTPGDPIQRGAICNSGACRNMLDFFDATIDKEGRVLVGWDDGCVGGCVNAEPNSFTAQATITRQSGGKRMFAANDPAEPLLAGAPNVTANANGSGTAIDLVWPVPDNGGATITSYKVYRKFGTGSFTLLATVSEPRYTDTSFMPLTTDNSYRVTAVNSIGEGPYCRDITVGTGPTEFACIEPGITTNNDTNPDGSDADSGQNTPADGSVNVRRLQVAEPFMGPGVNKLIFNLQVAPSLLSSPPPNSQWLIIWNSLAPTVDFDRRYVAMKTDANGVPTFEYGKFGVPLDATNPNPNANTPQPLGSADSGTYNLATGKIRIVLSNSKAENIIAGQTLAGLNVRTYLNRPDYPGFQRSQNNASDITADGSYTLVGNASCAVNQLPVAVLSAMPSSGNSPLMVTLNGGASYDPDAGDTVASYIFTFGDGTPDVEQGTSTIAHTYTCASGTCNYFASLKVKDNQGALSANTGVATIEVTNTATRVNYALGLGGASAIASTTHSSGGYPASSTIDGDRTGNTWGSGTGGWNDGTRGAFPDTLEITLPGASGKMIDEINVVTLQNNWRNAGEPTLATSCSGEGIIDFDVQYWTGSAWVTIPSGSVTGNNNAWRQFTFAAITTTKIRVVVNNSRNNWSRIVEVEAIGPGGQ
jgi:hypothetical protein